MPATPVARRIIADTSLLVVAAVWGATFPMGKAIPQHMPPFAYLGVRFVLATLVLLPFVASLTATAEPVVASVVTLQRAYAGAGRVV